MSRARKPNTRNITSTFRIYTEGQETEPNYVKGYIDDYLRQKGFFGYRIIARKPKDHSPYGLLTAAKAEMEEGDEVWLIFDRDDHKKIPQTFAEAKNANIKIAFSSICFEIWILMHFEYTTRHYTCYEELKSDKLLKYLPEYEKSASSLFRNAAGLNGERLQKAIDNAKKLCKHTQSANKGKNIYELGAYTDVYELLAEIDAFIKKIKTKGSPSVCATP